mmetsp:Transcript_11196/g.26930  ORF Transcript_11196/g.26930 Transcript_11196/m.26930 type:complete len:264 (+) Transcript_11196:1671-2462(+)
MRRAARAFKLLCHSHRSRAVGARTPLDPRIVVDVRFHQPPLVHAQHFGLVSLLCEKPLHHGIVQNHVAGNCFPFHKRGPGTTDSRCLPVFDLGVEMVSPAVVAEAMPARGNNRSQSRDILLLDVVKAYFASYVLFLLCDCHLGAGGRANCFALGSETNLCQGSILVLVIELCEFLVVPFHLLQKGPRHVCGHACDLHDSVDCFLLFGNNVSGLQSDKPGLAEGVRHVGIINQIFWKFAVVVVSPITLRHIVAPALHLRIAHHN